MKTTTFIWYGAKILIVLAIFWPALKGGYEFDDAVNLIRNTQVQLHFGDVDFLSRALGSGIASDLGRPVAMLSFALEHAFVGGFDPQVSKAINLVVHLLNMLVLALLAHAILRALLHLEIIDPKSFEALKRGVPFATLFWALLPANVSSVVYVIQRMNLLATLFSLTALYIYFHQRFVPLTAFRRVLAIFAACLSLFLGVLSKENTILALVFVLGFEGLIFYRRHIDNYRRHLAVAAPILIVASIFFISYLANSALADLYQLRTFDWSTRLMLQPLALLWYCAGSFLPFLVAPRFFMDFLETPHYLAMPIDAWLALVGILAVLLLLLWKLISRGSLLFYFSLGWFFVFHLMESTFWPLELGFLHRNYLPSVGLVWGASFLLVAVVNRYPKSIRHILLVLGVYGAMVAGAAALESLRWGDRYTLLSTEAEMRPISTRAAYTLGNWYFDNDPADIFCEEMFEQFDKVLENSPNSYSGYYGYIVGSEHCGNRLSQELIKDMEQLLADQPLAASSYLFLDILSDSCSDMRHFSCDQLDLLVKAVLSNPSITTRYTAGYEMVLAKNSFYSGDYQQALESGQRILSIEPEHLQAHLLMMDVMYKTGNCQGVAVAQKTLQEQRILYLIQRDIQPLNERYPDCPNIVMEQ